jgi:hypothetical protein
MIRTLLKLALVALVANAMWHLFGAYSPHYRFRDGVQYAAQYRGDSSDEVLQEKILAMASQFDVPVGPGEVSVTHDGMHTMVHVAYVRPIDLAPGFTYPWPFSFDVDILTLTPVSGPSGVPK